MSDKYKIFYKDQDLFYKDNKKKNESKKQFQYRVYNNIDNIKETYHLKENDFKKDIRILENQDYSYKKISEPLFVMMLNSIVKNSVKNGNTNRENFSLKKYVEYKKHTLKEVSNLPDDIAIKIKDSSVYDYDYEFTKFIDKFFAKIDEILNLIIVPNTMFSTISNNILTDLNLIIDRIKYILNLEKEIRMLDCIKNDDYKKLTGYSAEDFEKSLKSLNFEKIRGIMNLSSYAEFIEFMNLPSDIKYRKFLNIYSKGLYQYVINMANEDLELSNLYNNFEKYKSIDIIVGEEFSRLNELSDTIYDKFNFDEYNNNPNNIKLDMFSTRDEILCLLDKEDLKNELLSSLEPKIYSKKYIKYLLINGDPTKYSLKEFISIYKKISYDKFKLYLDDNKDCSNTDMYSEYKNIMNELDKKINLSEKSISTKINLASESFGKDVFYSFKNILLGLYKCILNSNYPIKANNITKEFISYTFSLIKSKAPFKNNYYYICGYKISQDSYRKIGDLIASEMKSPKIERNVLPEDVLNFFDALVLCYSILNSLNQDITDNNLLAFVNALNSKKVKEIRDEYEKKEISNIDMYLLISSNEKLVHEILSYINLEKTNYEIKNKKTFNLYETARINLNEIDRVGYDITSEDFLKNSDFKFIFNTIKNL